VESKKILIMDPGVSALLVPWMRTSTVRHSVTVYI